MEIKSSSGIVSTVDAKGRPVNDLEQNRVTTRVGGYRRSGNETKGVTGTMSIIARALTLEGRSQSAKDTLYVVADVFKSCLEALQDVDNRETNDPKILFNILKSKLDTVYKTGNEAWLNVCVQKVEGLMPIELRDNIRAIALPMILGLNTNFLIGRDPNKKDRSNEFVSLRNLNGLRTVIKSLYAMLEGSIGPTCARFAMHAIDPGLSIQEKVDITAGFYNFGKIQKDVNLTDIFYQYSALSINLGVCLKFFADTISVLNKDKITKQDLVDRRDRLKGAMTLLAAMYMDWFKVVERNIQKNDIYSRYWCELRESFKDSGLFSMYDNVFELYGKFKDAINETLKAHSLSQKEITRRSHLPARLKNIRTNNSKIPRVGKKRKKRRAFRSRTIESTDNSDNQRPTLTNDERGKIQNVSKSRNMKPAKPNSNTKPAHPAPVNKLPEMPISKSEVMEVSEPTSHASITNKPSNLHQEKVRIKYTQENVPQLATELFKKMPRYKVPFKDVVRMLREMNLTVKTGSGSARRVMLDGEQIFQFHAHGGKDVSQGYLKSLFGTLIYWAENHPEKFNGNKYLPEGWDTHRYGDKLSML